MLIVRTATTSWIGSAVIDREQKQTIPLISFNPHANEAMNWTTMHTSKLRHTLLLLLACLAATPVLAHEHDDDVSEEELNAPVDAILWIHMFLQASVWGFLFPIGMVLGLSRSRWHVPLQVRTSIRVRPCH